MSLDFQQVRQQIIEMGEAAPQRAQILREKREAAWGVLQKQASELKALRARVEAAMAANPHLRCALPGEERLDHRSACPSLPTRATLLAADGSQINPDRHASVDYCLVNVGGIRMALGTPDPPEIVIRSKLYYDEQMYVAGMHITERMVALMRDLRERELLAELAQTGEPPVIALTDGPLELWVGREGAQEAQEYERKFKEYLRALRQLHRLGACTAGYIDRPRGDLLVRLLEIATLPQDQLEEAGRAYRPFLGVTDANLFARLLAPGERSAIFGIQSRNADQYTVELALNFFYLNVGRDERHPYPVRVEIPAWVAKDAHMLDNLHAVLVHQCWILGARTYPYILHRSHEVAVVTHEEKQQVENMIAQELMRRGVGVVEPSHKQAAKEAGGRKRYR